MVNLEIADLDIHAGAPLRRTTPTYSPYYLARYICIARYGNITYVSKIETPKGHTMTTIRDLAQHTAGALGITPESAEDALTTYLHQLEVLDERSIDPDDISQDDAGSITDAVRSAQKSGDLGEQELADLEEAVARLFIAADDLATVGQLRDKAIRAALGAGARVEDVMRVTGLSRAQLYQI